MKKPKVIFLIGFPRSGTTLIGDVVNTISGFIHTGEISRTWGRKGHGLTPDRKCSCGDLLEDCEFWSPKFKALENFALEESITLDSLSIRNLRIDVLSKGKFNDARLDEYKLLIQKFYHLISQDNIVVDSSKELYFAELLERLDFLDIHYVHVIRNPKGVLLSRQRKLKKQNKKGQANVNYLYFFKDIFLWQWYNNKVNKFLKDKKSITFSYEAFSAQPKETILEMLSTMNFKVKSEELPLNNNMFIQKDNHLVMGNVNRFKKGPIEVKPDQRWKTELKPIDQKLVNFFTFFNYDESL